MSNSEQTTKAEQTAEKPKLTPEQREAQRKQALDDAAKKAVSSATNLRAYLAVQSRFERYSTNNNLLIFAQRPDATRLKSLELWNKEKKLFIRFVLAKAAVTWGLDLMMAMFTIVQGIISKMIASSGIGGRSGIYPPGEMIKTIEDCGFWESIPLWAVTLIGSLLIWVLSFILILTVYGRMFKLFMYAAIAPIPLSSFAGEETGNIGRSFLKSFAGVCLEGAIIVLACVIYSLFASVPPSVSTGASAITQVWTYVGEIVFNMLVLVGTVKLSDQVVSKMLGI